MCHVSGRSAAAHDGLIGRSTGWGVNFFRALPSRRTEWVMSIDRITPYLPLVALLTWAAVTDVRERRIPNWLTLTVLLSGLAQSCTRWALIPLSQSLYGLLVAFAVGIVLYALGARGGGDVKLLSGIGAWIGVRPVLWVFAAAAIVSLVVVLVQCAIQGKLGLLFRNTAVTLLAVVNVRRLGAEHVLDTGRHSRSIDRPLPNAVPLLIATIAVVLWTGGRMWSGS